MYKNCEYSTTASIKRDHWYVNTYFVGLTNYSGDSKLGDPDMFGTCNKVPLWNRSGLVDFKFNVREAEDFSTFLKDQIKVVCDEGKLTAS